MIYIFAIRSRQCGMYNSSLCLIHTEKLVRVVDLPRSRKWRESVLYFIYLFICFAWLFFMWLCIRFLVKCIIHLTANSKRFWSEPYVHDVKFVKNFIMSIIILSGHWLISDRVDFFFTKMGLIGLIQYGQIHNINSLQLGIIQYPTNMILLSMTKVLDKSYDMKGFNHKSKSEPGMGRKLTNWTVQSLSHRQANSQK